MQEDITNENGKVFLTLWASGSEGRLEINAIVEGYEASDEIQTVFLDGSVGTLTISALPDVLFDDFDTDASSLIRVTISDVNRAAISGVYLRLKATGGILMPITPTDAAGYAQSVWKNLDMFGTFDIIVLAGDQTDTVRVTVHENFE